GVLLLERAHLGATDERRVGDHTLEACLHLFGHVGVRGLQVDERDKGHDRAFSSSTNGSLGAGRSSSSLRASRSSSSASLASRSSCRRPSVCLTERTTSAARPTSAPSSCTSCRRSTPSPVSTSTHPATVERPTTRPAIRPE